MELNRYKYICKIGLTEPSISNEKPSAIFKINANATNSQVDLENQMVDDGETVEQYDINVGISIEPLESVQNQQAMVTPSNTANKTPANSPSNSVNNTQDIAVLANRIMKHAYNFLSGFTTPDGKVPMKAFDDWWNKFKHKLDMNPKFLDEIEE